MVKPKEEYIASAQATIINFKAQAGSPVTTGNHDAFLLASRIVDSLGLHYDETSAYLPISAIDFIIDHRACYPDPAPLLPTKRRDERRISVDMFGIGPLIARVRCLHCNAELEINQTTAEYIGSIPAKRPGPGRPKKRRRRGEA